MMRAQYTSHLNLTKLAICCLARQARDQMKWGSGVVMASRVVVGLEEEERGTLERYADRERKTRKAVSIYF